MRVLMPSAAVALLLLLLLVLVTLDCGNGLHSLLQRLNNKRFSVSLPPSRPADRTATATATATATGTVTTAVSRRPTALFSETNVKSDVAANIELDVSITANTADTPSYNSSEVIKEYLEEIRSLRGTPELVDRLENLVSRYPGIEVEIELYKALYGFPLDDFQEKGLQLLIDGNNVLVTTPTGSGKTLVGELAIYFALMLGLRVAYTTPLKALSNQKFQDFRNKYGGDRVGLLTGDIAINRGAAITVMTTEVFRNMIYDTDSHNQLANLFMVCFDEFHFMNDPERGTVWEESVISCPPSVRILALSATMGNVDDIKGWIESIHGPTELVVSEKRPVPLRYFFGLKQGLYPLFRDPNAGPGALSGVVEDRGSLDAGSMLNPSITKIEEQFFRKAQARMTSRSSKPVKMGKANPQALIPKYTDIAEELYSLDKLPAIVFIFSRDGCEQAGKMVMQTKVKLLKESEVSFVNQAIARFMQNNPEIPISKTAVQLLRNGIGVHHAGLITVWKAFIEDLFNANLIKILFATETLAAGVNMPARTTVITTVTKRISSETVRLKTSQLLQMAGRAGRRGLDTEGTVVIVRNRFEDATMGHKILTSPIDGIKSHFKTSYALTVKLLQTKTMDECKALIERGFGAYLLQKRIEKKEKKKESAPVDEFRAVLQNYTFAGAKAFLKIARRLEKETRSYEFLLNSVVDSEKELVQAIVDYMPIGTGVVLRGESDSLCGYFLGDVKWGKSNSNKGLGIITRDGDLLVVQKDHIRSFADTDYAIAVKTSQQLLELVTIATSWEDIAVPVCKSPMMRGVYPEENLDETLTAAMRELKNSKQFPLPSMPGSVKKQKAIVDDILDEYNGSDVVINGEGDLVINALKYVAKLKDPVSFINKQANNQDGLATRDVFAWTMFQSTFQLLRQFNAIESNTTIATDLGDMISSLTADNELWLAIVLSHSSVLDLNAGELGALINGVVVDGYKASNAYFKDKPTETLQRVHSELEPLYLNLKLAQNKAGIDFPMYLSIDAAGMITSWINGVSWRDLCKETSLDQGDICRMLRRTLEVLRQIPNAFNVRPEIVALAFEAAERMDRFPVADFDSGKTDGNSTTITAGVGFDTPRDFSKDINELMKEDSDEDVDYSAMNIDELLREDQDNGEDDDEDLLSVFEDESDIADVKGSKSDDELTKINVIRQEKIESIISEMESEIEGNKRNDKEHTQTVDRNDGDSDRDNSPGDLDIDSLLEWNDQILE